MHILEIIVESIITKMLSKITPLPFRPLVNKKLENNLHKIDSHNLLSFCLSNKIIAYFVSSSSLNVKALRKNCNDSISSTTNTRSISNCQQNQ